MNRPSPTLALQRVGFWYLVVGIWLSDSLHKRFGLAAQFYRSCIAQRSRPRSNAQCSSLTAQRSTLTAQCSSLTAQRSTLVAHGPTLDAHRSRPSARRSPPLKLLCHLRHVPEISVQRLEKLGMPARHDVRPFEVIFDRHRKKLGAVCGAVTPEHRMPRADPPHLSGNEVVATAWSFRLADLRLFESERTLEVEQVREFMQSHVVSVRRIGPIGTQRIDRENDRPLQMRHSIERASASGEVVIIEPVGIKERGVAAGKLELGAAMHEQRAGGRHHRL